MIVAKVTDGDVVHYTTDLETARIVAKRDSTLLYEEVEMTEEEYKKLAKPGSGSIFNTSRDS